MVDQPIPRIFTGFKFTDVLNMGRVFLGWVLLQKRGGTSDLMTVSRYRGCSRVALEVCKKDV